MKKETLLFLVCIVFAVFATFFIFKQPVKKPYIPPAELPRTLVTPIEQDSYCLDHTCKG